MAQGEMVAELIAGHSREFDMACIPSVCFTDPEIVEAGLSLAQCEQAGLETLVGHFPFMANGRALSTQSVEGFTRIVARREDHAVVGVQAVGTGVSEFAAAFGLAIEMGARLEDIAATIHAHPTRGETIQEAALGALGRAIHL
jgi:dihydrolipoamide dehydrogenase